MLHGERVRLRPWTVRDADDVYAACQDPEIQRWTTVPSPYTYSDALSYVSDVAPAAWVDGGAVYAVVAALSNRVCGAIGVHAMVDGVANLGYWTAADARRQGLTVDALRVLTKYFLTSGGAVRVELVAEPDNAASVGVATAAGFTAEGVLRQRLLLKGRRADVVMFSMLPTDPAASTL